MRTSAFVVACLVSTSAALRLSSHQVAKSTSNPRYAQLLNKLSGEQSEDSGEDSEADADDVKAVFDKMDANGDGAVTKEEGKAAIVNYCADPDHQCPKLNKKFWKEANKFFNSVDTNKDGKITWDEVEASMDKVKEHSPKKEDVAPDSFAQLKNKITKSAEDKVKEVFNKMDTNDDGAVSKEEAKAATVAYCEDPSHKCPPLDAQFWEQANAFFDAVDTNSDGKITWDEVKAVMNKQAPPASIAQLFTKQDERPQACPSNPEEAKEIFKFMDADGNGNVTKKEGKEAIIKYCTANAGECPPLNKDFWDQAGKIFALVDADNNGEISKAEAKAAYKTHCAPYDK